MRTSPEARAAAPDPSAAGSDHLLVVGSGGPLVVLLLGSTLVVMAGAVLSPVLAVIRGELTLSGTAAGLVLTAHALALAVASPVVGWLVDRHGARGPLAGGLLLYGGAGGAGLFLSSYPALLASRVVFGLGAAAVFTGTTVALLELYRGPLRHTVMGWRSTATSLGGVGWPLLGGALGGLSWHAPFAVYLLGVPLALATWLALPAGAADLGRRDAPQERPDHAGAAAGGVLHLLHRRPLVLGVYALLATGTVLLYGLLVLVPLRLAELGVRAPFAVAALSVAMSVAMSLAGLAYATTVTRIGATAVLRGTYLAWVAAFALLATTDQLSLVVLAQAVFGAGMGLAIPTLTVMLEDASPVRLRARVMALSGTAIFLGQFVSPLLLGPLADAVSITTGFTAAGLLAAAVLLALLVAGASRTAPADSPDPTVGGAR